MWTNVHPDVYDVTVRQDEDARWRAFFFDDTVPTLVDAGFGDTVDELAAALAEIGATPERLILTHGDPDHAGGAAGVVDRYDLDTWVPDGMAIEEITPDHRYGDEADIGRFTAVSTPGHTPNHHSLVDEAGDIAVIGDALFGSSARGLPAGYFVLPTAHYSADLATADESLERLLEFEFDVGLVYHGESVTTDASEKIARFVDFAGKA